MHKRFAFHGGSEGKWRVISTSPVCGQPLPSVPYIDVTPLGHGARVPSATWTLHGLISNIRYATRNEVNALKAKQEAIGRPHVRMAAMIPLKKSAAWWDLAQDERRAIFEEQSRHTHIGMAYLPAIARQLYHCRDLSEPFDFVTWFEYGQQDAEAFEELVAALRSTKEWSFVEREVDIRLERTA